MGEHVLEVSHLNAWYGHRKKRKQVLFDVDFCIKKGEILGLVGESGCGKSTLCKAVLGFLKDTEGEIRHFTQSPQMVFQDPFGSLNPSKKIGWILEEPLRMQPGLPSQVRRQRAAAMAEKVGLETEILDRYPRDLSGGQRQRVSIAISLLQGSKLILADEPVSALDVTIQKQIMELMLDLQEELELSYLFISHDLNVIYQMCDRVMVMRAGRIVEIQEAEEIFANPGEAYTRELLCATPDI